MASLEELERDWTLDQMDLAFRSLDAFDIAERKAEDERRRSPKE